jgi:hypothetical protein
MEIWKSGHLEIWVGKFTYTNAMDDEMYGRLKQCLLHQYHQRLPLC